MKKKSYAKKTAKENLLYVSVLLMLLILFAAFIGLYISVVFSFRDTIMICAGIFIGASFYYMMEKILKKRFLPQWGKYKGFTQGAVGESLVHDALVKNMDTGNIILADVVLEENMGNIDHIVIGKHGVFVIETKTHRGRIIVDVDTWFQEKKIGERNDQMLLRYSPSKQAKSNAIRLKSFLRQNYPKLSDEWIKAIVVFPNIQSKENHVDIKMKPTDCEIFDSIDVMLEEIKKEKTSVELTSADLSQLEEIFLPMATEVKINN